MRREVKKGLESEGYRVGEDGACLPIPDRVVRTGGGWVWEPIGEGCPVWGTAGDEQPA